MYEEISKKMSNKKIVSGGYRFGFFDMRLFKNNYCCKCGRKLIIKRTNYLILLNRIMFLEAQHHTDYFYHCDHCDYYIEYKNQKIISKVQKEKGSIELVDAKELILRNKVKFKKIGKYLIYKWF